MDIQALFGLSILMSFVAFGLVTKLYIWPRLRALERNDALVPLVLPHTFRFVGLAFLVPGVVSPSLPQAFAAPAAYGDLVAAILAIASTIALSRHAPFATLLVWLFNVWGAGDLLFAFYQGLFGVQRNSSNTFSRVSVCRLTTRQPAPPVRCFFLASAGGGGPVNLVSLGVIEL